MLTIGYIPEHFSTPIFFAEKYGFFKKHNVEIALQSFPSGSGHLIQCLESGEIDVSIGLTEAHIRAIAAGSEAFKLVGTYVQSPLCWAVSTGSNRPDLPSVDVLEGKVIGVSRMGSGSDVMSKVLQHQRKWSTPFTYVVNNDFKNLRDGVNHTGTAHPSDAFMWEHFTSKKYYDSGEIKRIGEIYTPWPSWVISARPEVVPQLEGFIAALNEGVAYFRAHQDEAVEWISSNLDYSQEDAREWLKTVQFSDDVGVIDGEVVSKTLSTLKLAVELPQGCEKKEYVANC